MWVPKLDRSLNTLRNMTTEEIDENLKEIMSPGKVRQGQISRVEIDPHTGQSGVIKRNRLLTQDMDKEDFITV